MGGSATIRSGAHREALHLLLTKAEVVMPLVSSITVFAVFTAIAPGFATPRSIAGVLSIASELGITTLGIALLLISGEFNLAVSSLFILSPLVTTWLANAGVNPFAALAASIVVAAGIGALMGYTVVRSGLHSFIVTLGFAMFLRGLALYLTGGFPQEYEADPSLLYALNGRMAWGFRISMAWFLLITLGLVLVLHLTKYGNWTYAAGGNPLVAHEVGVPVRKVKILNFMVSSAAAGFAGCLSLGRLGVIDPSLGYGLELESLAAAVLGGCSLTGGYGSVIGAFLGTLALSMFRVGLVLAGAPPYWYQAFIGPLLIGAAAVNYLLARRALAYR